MLSSFSNPYTTELKSYLSSIFISLSNPSNTEAHGVNV